MSGTADWSTLIALAIVAVTAWAGGFWFSSQIRQTSQEIDRRLRDEVSDLKTQIAAIIVKNGGHKT